MKRTFRGLVALTLLAVVVQFFLAASGAFDTAPREEAFEPHRALGYLVLVLAVVSTVVGALAKVPARLVGTTGLVVGLVVLQPVIAGVASSLDESGSSTTAGELVFGLHAVNGLVIAALLGTVLRRSREPGEPAGVGAEAASGPRSGTGSAA